MIVPLLAFLGAVLLALYFAFSWDNEDRKCRLIKEKVPRVTLWSILAPLLPCFWRQTQVLPEHNIEMTTINNQEGSESATSVALSSDDLTLRKEWKRRERRAFQEKLKGKSVGSEHSILDEALPEVFRSNTYIEKLTAELKRHHRWFNILYYYSDVYPRALRVLSLATNIITTLFFIAITYSVANPDENDCLTYSNKDDCLEPKSHFHTGQPQCRWDNNALQCSFVQPSVLIRVILFVVIFAVMLALPVNIVTNYLIQYVLAAPIKVTDHAMRHSAAPSKYQVAEGANTEPNKAALSIPVYSSTQDNDDQYIQNNEDFAHDQDRLKPFSDRHSPVGSLPISPLSNNNDPISTYQHVTDLLRGKLDVTTVTTPLLAKYKTHRDRAQQELELLQNDVRKHRLTYMTGVLDRRKFDRVWGLSSTGLFLVPDPVKASDGCSHRCAHFASRLCCSCIRTDPTQARAELYKDILRALQTEQREIARINAHALSEPEIGKMLLLQLHVDLLPTTAGNILACKGKRDQPAVLPVYWWYKLLVWVVILAVNVYFLYTLFGFAATQSSARRTAWFKSFMLFIVLDCVGLVTNSVLATHVLVPCLALSEVQRVKEYLIHKLQKHDIDTQKSAVVKAQLGRRPIRIGAVAVIKNEPAAALNTIHSLTLAPPVTSDIESGSTALSFNAAKYLYTSYRLSVYFPTLCEAQIVQFFVLQMPRPAQFIDIVEEMRLVNERKNENSASSAASKDRRYVYACNVLTVLLHVAYVCVLPLVHIVLLFPLYLQDALLDYITIVLFGYLLLLHMILYAFYPPLAFVPPFVGSVLAHFIIVSGNSEMQTKLANLKKQTLAARQEARKLNNRRAQQEAGDAKNVTPYEVAQKKVVTIVVSAAPASGSNIPNNTHPAGGLQQQQPSTATPSAVTRSNVLSSVAEASESSAPQTPYTAHTPYTPSPVKGSKGPAPNAPNDTSPVKGPAPYQESPVKGPTHCVESPVKGPAPTSVGSPANKGASGATERDSRLQHFFSSADKVLHTHQEHDSQDKDSAAVTKAVNAVTAASKEKPQHTTAAAEDKSDISSSMTSMNTSFNTVMQPHQSWSNLKAGEKYSPTGKAATAGGAPSPNRANRLVKKASRPASTFKNGASGGAP